MSIFKQCLMLSAISFCMIPSSSLALNSKNFIIKPSDGGVYKIQGSINKKPVNFIIDTGASLVTMGGNIAKNLNIDYSSAGKRVSVRTASGSAPAYRVKLQSVSIGNITLKNVDGLVLSGQYLRSVLFGMSAINRLHMSHTPKGLAFQTTTISKSKNKSRVKKHRHKKSMHEGSLWY